MNNDGKTCKHCGAPMSEPKPVNTGPRKGQTHTVCTKCGHIKYLAASPGTLVEMVAGPGTRNSLMPQPANA